MNREQRRAAARSRQPKGVSTGGQFATEAKTETSVHLDGRDVTVSELLLSMSERINQESLPQEFEDEFDALIVQSYSDDFRENGYTDEGGIRSVQLIPSSGPYEGERISVAMTGEGVKISGYEGPHVIMTAGCSSDEARTALGLISDPSTSPFGLPQDWRAGMAHPSTWVHKGGVQDFTAVMIEMPGLRGAHHIQATHTGGHTAWSVAGLGSRARAYGSTPEQAAEHFSDTREFLAHIDRHQDIDVSSMNRALDGSYSGAMSWDGPDGSAAYTLDLASNTATIVTSSARVQAPYTGARWHGDDWRDPVKLARGTVPLGGSHEVFASTDIVPAGHAAHVEIGSDGSVSTHYPVHVAAGDGTAQPDSRTQITHTVDADGNESWESISQASPKRHKGKTLAEVSAPLRDKPNFMARAAGVFLQNARYFRGVGLMREIKSGMFPDL